MFLILADKTLYLFLFFFVLLKLKYILFFGGLNVFFGLLLLFLLRSIFVFSLFLLFNCNSQLYFFLFYIIITVIFISIIIYKTTIISIFNLTRTIYQHKYYLSYNFWKHYYFSNRFIPKNSLISSKNSHSRNSLITNSGCCSFSSLILFTLLSTDIYYFLLNCKSLICC